MNEKPTLKLSFDHNTIEHLGVALYSQLPSVLSELISNSWDADAIKVEINFTDTGKEKSIEYSDNGTGMTFDELNEKYLLIGRNRRKENGQGRTNSGRKVIGKKGLGKLSVFGICSEIQIRTVKDGLLNEFKMNIEEIRKCETKEYNPQIINFNIKVNEPSSTKINLSGMIRKSAFNLENIANSVSKKFLIFDQMQTLLAHNNQDDVIIKNEDKFKGFPIQFEWNFPLSLDSKYEYADRIKGRIVTLQTPVKDSEMKGIYLTSRGKIVNNASFYGLRDTDQFHSYVTGYLEVDFIDEFEMDVISTDRHSLNWEFDETKELQDYLQAVIRHIGNDWRKKRAKEKSDAITHSGLDIDQWQDSLPSYEKDLSKRIIDPVLENSDINTEDSTRIITSVKDKFDNKVFKDYASRIADLDKPEDIPVLLNLMEEWKTIENKQYSDLALSRIEVINKFEEYLDTDTKEVPTLHNFLKKFSWLLDPRILEFKDEVTFSKLLEENFPNKELDMNDRRIDFLCSNALGGVLYVIEIKRSQYKADRKAIEQAYEYGVFLRNAYSSSTSFSTVVCYLVCGSKSTEPVFQAKEETYRKSGEVFVKTYRELLEQSKEYHREFIDLYKANLN